MVLSYLGWAIVDRVNPTTVSVTLTDGGVKGMQSKYPYAKIQEHRSGTSTPS
jgi:hypothetical protein